MVRTLLMVASDGTETVLCVGRPAWVAKVLAAAAAQGPDPWLGASLSVVDGVPDDLKTEVAAAPPWPPP